MALVVLCLVVWTSQILGTVAVMNSTTSSSTYSSAATASIRVNAAAPITVPSRAASPTLPWQNLCSYCDPVSGGKCTIMLAPCSTTTQASTSTRPGTTSLVAISTPSTASPLPIPTSAVTTIVPSSSLLSKATTTDALLATLSAGTPTAAVSQFAATSTTSIGMSPAGQTSPVLSSPGTTSVAPTPSANISGFLSSSTAFSNSNVAIGTSSATIAGDITTSPASYKTTTTPAALISTGAQTPATTTFGPVPPSASGIISTQVPYTTAPVMIPAAVITPTATIFGSALTSSGGAITTSEVLYQTTAVSTISTTPDTPAVTTLRSASSSASDALSSSELSYTTTPIGSAMTSIQENTPTETTFGEVSTSASFTDKVTAFTSTITQFHGTPTTLQAPTDTAPLLISPTTGMQTIVSSAVTAPVSSDSRISDTTITAPTASESDIVTPRTTMSMISQATLALDGNTVELATSAQSEESNATDIFRTAAVSTYITEHTSVTDPSIIISDPVKTSSPPTETSVASGSTSTLAVAITSSQVGSNQVTAANSTINGISAAETTSPASQPGTISANVKSTSVLSTHTYAAVSAQSTLASTMNNNDTQLISASAQVITTTAGTETAIPNPGTTEAAKVILGNLRAAKLIKSIPIPTQAQGTPDTPLTSNSMFGATSAAAETSLDTTATLDVATFATTTFDPILQKSLVADTALTTTLPAAANTLTSTVNSSVHTIMADHTSLDTTSKFNTNLGTKLPSTSTSIATPSDNSTTANENISIGTPTSKLAIVTTSVANITNVAALTSNSTVDTATTFVRSLRTTLATDRTGANNLTSKTSFYTTSTSHTTNPNASVDATTKFDPTWDKIRLYTNSIASFGTTLAANRSVNITSTSENSSDARYTVNTGLGTIGATYTSSNTTSTFAPTFAAKSSSNSKSTSDPTLDMTSIGDSRLVTALTADASSEISGVSLTTAPVSSHPSTAQILVRSSILNRNMVAEHGWNTAYTDSNLRTSSASAESACDTSSTMCPSEYPAFTSRSTPDDGLTPRLTSPADKVATPLSTSDASVGLGAYGSSIRHMSFTEALIVGAIYTVANSHSTFAPMESASSETETTAPKGTTGDSSISLIYPLQSATTAFPIYTGMRRQSVTSSPFTVDSSVETLPSAKPLLTTPEPTNRDEIAFSSSIQSTNDPWTNLAQTASPMATYSSSPDASATTAMTSFSSHNSYEPIGGATGQNEATKSLQSILSSRTTSISNEESENKSQPSATPSFQYSHLKPTTTESSVLSTLESSSSDSHSGNQNYRTTTSFTNAAISEKGSISTTLIRSPTALLPTEEASGATDTQQLSLTTNSHSSLIPSNFRSATAPEAVFTTPVLNQTELTGGNTSRAMGGKNPALANIGRNHHKISGRILQESTVEPTIATASATSDELVWSSSTSANSISDQTPADQTAPAKSSPAIVTTTAKFSSPEVSTSEDVVSSSSPYPDYFDHETSAASQNPLTSTKSPAATLMHKKTSELSVEEFGTPQWSQSPATNFHTVFQSTTDTHSGSSHGQSVATEAASGEYLASVPTETSTMSSGNTETAVDNPYYHVSTTINDDNAIGNTDTPGETYLATSQAFIRETIPDLTPSGHITSPTSEYYNSDSGVTDQISTATALLPHFTSTSHETEDELPQEQMRKGTGASAKAQTEYITDHEATTDSVSLDSTDNVAPEQNISGTGVPYVGKRGLRRNVTTDIGASTLGAVPNAVELNPTGKNKKQLSRKSGGGNAITESQAITTQYFEQSADTGTPSSSSSSSSHGTTPFPHYPSTSSSLSSSHNVQPFSHYPSTSSPSDTSPHNPAPQYPSTSASSSTSHNPPPFPQYPSTSASSSTSHNPPPFPQFPTTSSSSSTSAHNPPSIPQYPTTSHNIPPLLATDESYTSPHDITQSSSTLPGQNQDENSSNSRKGAQVTPASDTGSSHIGETGPTKKTDTIPSTSGKITSDTGEHSDEPRGETGWSGPYSTALTTLKITDSSSLTLKLADSSSTTSKITEMSTGPSPPQPSSHNSSSGESADRTPSSVSDTQSHTVGDSTTALMDGQEPSEHCYPAEWVAYGPCSSTCGTGTLVRYRSYDAAHGSAIDCKILDQVAQCTDLPQCNPMTEVAKVASNVMMKMGCIWILSGLGLAIFSFMCLRHHYYLQVIHVNEDISLFLAHLILLLFGVRNDSQFSQYFFCVTFLLQAVEALHIYTVLTNVVMENNAFVNIKAALVVCWVLPAVVTGVTAATSYRKLISDFSCWINIGDHVLLATAIPVCIWAVPTVVLLEATGHSSTNRRSSKISSARLARGGLSLVFSAQFPSWCITASAIYYQTWWLFTAVLVLNITLGVFIYMYHVLANEKARAAVKELYRWIRKKRGRVLPDATC